MSIKSINEAKQFSRYENIKFPPKKYTLNLLQVKEPLIEFIGYEER